MTSPRDPLDETLMKAFLDGDPAARRQASGTDAELERELQELESLGRRLERAGQDARDDLAGADEMTDPAPHEERVTEIVRKLAAATAAGSPPAAPYGRRPARIPPVRRSSSAAIWALAAAVLLLAVAVAYLRTAGDRVDVILDVDALTLVRPIGEASDFTEFVWEGKRPEAGWFRVLVKAAPGGRTLVQSEKLDESRWSPDAAERERMPDAIYWEVEVREAGRLVDAKGASARRRS